MDSLVVAFATYSFITCLILHASAEAVKYKLGILYDLLGMYFVFRCLVRTLDDLTFIARGFVIVSIPIAIAFFIENRTSRNLFSSFGGVPEITIEREGRLRCQGAFAHPILAGCFWAAAIPLIAAQWWNCRSSRFVISLGVLCSLAIVMFCASSTPIIGLMAIVVGTVMFRYRTKLRAFRWSLLLALCILHLIREKPVWHLLGRISLVGGSTSYHRYMVIDQAINHIDEWWLFGSAKGSAHWGYGMEDLTNMYVVWGMHGGLGLTAIFVAIIACGFRDVGRACKILPRNRGELISIWCVGLFFLVHVMSFIGTTYFGQINMSWHLAMAMVGSLAALASGDTRTVMGATGAGGRAGKSALQLKMVHRRIPNVMQGMKHLG